MKSRVLHKKLSYHRGTARCPVSVEILIIIQYLYSALKSCKGHRGAGGFRLRLSEQVCFEVFLKECKV